MTETADAYNAEADRPLDDLQDALVQCEIAAASDRQKHDRFIATCRDHLHIALQLVGPIDPTRIHRVIDILDEYLRRSKN